MGAATLAVVSCRAWPPSVVRVLLAEHLETFLAQVELEIGTGLPEFVEEEFDAFLECGILAHVFLRLRCADCAHERLVAFSCKRRGFCPSCNARRMAETAARLVDHVIPRVPVRQWVLSFPIPLRWLFAHPELLYDAGEGWKTGNADTRTDLL